MKRWLALLALGILALGVQGGLATLLPRAYVPDLGLLVVVVIGLEWSGFASGILLAAALGFAADLLSGSLMGSHSLLRVLVYCSAALAHRQLNLRGAMPLGLFMAGMTMLYSVLLIALTRFFGLIPVAEWSSLASLFPHAIINAICAPPMSAFVAWMLERLSGDDSFRGGMQLDARGPGS
jgi:rod shape-determining protein MreD